MNDETPPEISAKEAYERRKEEKKQKKAQLRKAQHRQTLAKKTTQSFGKYVLWSFIIIVVLAIIVGGVAFLIRLDAPEGEDFGVSYTSQGAQHIADGAEHPAYNSNPPSSGWHYASPARGGFYDEAIPDERVVHNLEHGDIWIAYHPDVSDEVKAALRQFAGRYVVVSPRTQNEGDISLVAWGRVDTFDVASGALDENRISDFIKRYDNRGPERVR
ncbi:MAG: DUF3105 domain-containing protein [Candidatus Paceibacteria bacterium]